jgi:hypothetical protein
MARVACTNAQCKSGLVPHVKRKIDGGEPDPWDYQTEETCTTCGGAGSLLYVAPKVVAETKPASMYDYGCCG